MSDSTSYSTSINPGAPPLRWDNVYEAFRQVNANFEILEAALGAAGITPINFSDLDSSVIPSSNAAYVLGDITKQWKSVFTAAYSEVPGNELNGLWAGSAQIKGVAFTVNLPAGSTIGGNPITGVGTELIIDPDKNWFKTIQIDGGDSIVATEVNDSFNIVSGNGISLDVDSAAESIEITNTGILDVTAGTGISRTIVSGTANIVNTGVLSLANIGSIGTRTSGLGIHVSSAAGNPVITNTGVLSITAGSGALIVSTDAVTGVVTITNNSPAQPAFQQVEVDGDSANRLVADSTAGVLRVVGGYAITLAKTVGTDTLTINVDPAHDIRGSVFADDSTVLVNAVDGTLHGNFIGSVFADDSTQIIDGNTATVYGNIEATTLRTADTKIALGSGAGSSGQTTGAIAVGTQAGELNQGLAVAIGLGAGQGSQGFMATAVGNAAAQVSQGTYAVAVGTNSGQTDQGNYAVAIGPDAGKLQQGLYAVAIGRKAGETTQPAGSIIINASGGALNGSAAGLYIDPIRSTTSAASPVVYNSSTKELFYTSTLEFINSTISTTDSSGLTVDVQTTFNTDVTFENDLTVNNQMLVRGQKVILLNDLKAVVAASSSFADFQTRIAALV